MTQLAYGGLSYGSNLDRSAGFQSKKEYARRVLFRQYVDPGSTDIRRKSTTQEKYRRNRSTLQDKKKAGESFARTEIEFLGRSDLRLIESFVRHHLRVALISTWRHVVFATPISHAPRNNNRRMNTFHVIYLFIRLGFQQDPVGSVSDSFHLYELHEYTGRYIFILIRRNEARY